MNSYILAAVLSAVFMGTIGAVAVYADVSAETVTFYRLFIGAVLMGCFLLFTDQHGECGHVVISGAGNRVRRCPLFYG